MKRRLEIEEKLFLLLEHERLYLCPSICAASVAILIKEDLGHCNDLLIQKYGLKLNQLINVYRIQFARILIRRGYDYEKIWAISGFKSKCSFQRAFSCVVL